jgi:hypothetical protein
LAALGVSLAALGCQVPSAAAATPPRVTSALSVGPHGSVASARPAPAVASPFAAQVEREERPKPARARAGLYGGGQLGRTGQFVRLRLSRGRLAAVQLATLTSRCAGFGAPLVENIRIAPIEVPEDGEFVIESEFNEVIPPEVPRIGGLERTGLLTGRTTLGRSGGASGVLRSRFLLRDPATGDVRARCGTGAVRFSMRIPGPRPARGKARPQRGASYFGTTGQRQPLLLRVGPGGRTVGAAGMAYTVSCASALGRPFQLVARAAGIRRGRFDKRGTFVREYLNAESVVVRESYRWRLAGRFGATGATGLWRVLGTSRRTDTGEVLETCDTDRNRWSARQ